MIEIFLDFFAERGGGSHPIQNFSNHKLSIFFWKWGGGVFPNPKFPYQKKLSFLLDFFCQKGGGSHLFQEGFYHKILIFVIKCSVFSSNTQFFFFNFSKYFFFDIKKYFFISEFIRKGEGGVWPNPKFLLTEKD